MSIARRTRGGRVACWVTVSLQENIRRTWLAAVNRRAHPSTHHRPDHHLSEYRTAKSGPGGAMTPTTAGAVLLRSRHSAADAASDQAQTLTEHSDGRGSTATRKARSRSAQRSRGGKIHITRPGSVGATEPCPRVAVVRRWRCGCGLRERVRRRHRRSEASKARQSSLHAPFATH